MQELETLHNNGISLVDPADISSCLRGRNNLYNHLDLLIKDATKSINIMTTEKGFLRKVEGLRASLEKAKKKGVKIRIAEINSALFKYIAEKYQLKRSYNPNNLCKSVSFSVHFHWWRAHNPVEKFLLCWVVPRILGVNERREKQRLQRKNCQKNCKE